MSRQLAGAAFDLDNTLGWFGLTNPLAYLWSPEQLTNPEQARVNAPLSLSPLLLKKLAKARTVFVRLLVEREDLLFLVLRPNLRVLLEPLIRAWRRGALDYVVVYSNTPTSYSVELAIALIERYFKVPGLFSYSADHWNELRDADRPDEPGVGPLNYVEPFKTLPTLQRLFQAAGARAEIPTERILFVDDRQPRHTLDAFVPDGLTYIQPTSYEGRATKAAARDMLKLAMAALDSQGLLKDPQYLYSPFCFRNIPHSWTQVHTLHGFPDLWTFVESAIALDVVDARSPKWKDDTMQLSREVTAYLEKIETHSRRAHKTK
jgi:hypothetical protein